MNAAWEGSAVEATIHSLASAGFDTSYQEAQYDEIAANMDTYCADVGVALASAPGAETLCSDMFGLGGTLATLTQSSERYGIPTYFLSFARQQVDAFLAAAGC